MNGMAISEKNSFQLLVVVSCSVHDHLWHNLLQMKSLWGCLMVTLDGTLLNYLQKFIPYLFWPPNPLWRRLRMDVCPPFSFRPDRSDRPSIPGVCSVCFVRKNRPLPRLGRMPPSHQVDAHNHGEREGKAADRDGKCFFLSQEKQFLTIMENTSSSGEIWKVLLETMWTNVGIKWDLSKTAYYVCLDIRISFM